MPCVRELIYTMVLRKLSSPTHAACLNNTERLQTKNSFLYQFHSIQFKPFQLKSKSGQLSSMHLSLNLFPFLQQPRVAQAGPPGLQGQGAPRLPEASVGHHAQHLQHCQRHRSRRPGRHRPPGHRDDRHAEPFHRAGLPNGRAGWVLCPATLFCYLLLACATSRPIHSPFSLLLRKHVILACDITSRLIHQMPCCQGG